MGMRGGKPQAPSSVLLQPPISAALLCVFPPLDMQNHFALCTFSMRLILVDFPKGSLVRGLFIPVSLLPFSSPVDRQLLEGKEDQDSWRKFSTVAVAQEGRCGKWLF